MLQIHTDKAQHRFSLMILFASCFLFPVSCFLFPVSCYSQEVSSVEPILSTELIQNAQEYDGKEVIYEGEVIGEIMRRNGGVWVNVKDGDYSIGVWMSPELAELIHYRGSYKMQGDILRISGIFNRACSQHGGDLDIHAISLRKIKSGWERQERVILAKRDLLITLLVVLCLILILRVLIIR